MSRFMVVANQNAAPADIANLAAAIQNGGGHIVQSWGNSVLISEGSPQIQNDIVQQPGGAGTFSERN